VWIMEDLWKNTINLVQNVPTMYANFIITVRKKKKEVLLSCRPVALAARCSLMTIPRQSTECHYMTLRTACGVL